MMKLASFLVGHPFDISPVINALLGEIFQRTNTTGSQFECRGTIQTFEIQQIIGRFVISRASS